MIRHLTIAAALGLTVCGPLDAQEESGYVQRQQRMARLHTLELVEGWLIEASVPGCVVALVEGSHTLLLEGFGVAHLDDRTPVEPDETLFLAGDLVRTFTAAAVLQLVERSELELDESVTGRGDLRLYVEEPFGAVTPRGLLLHTAGIDRRRVASRTRDLRELEDLGTYLERRMPAQVRAPGLVSLPSEHGYALAGRLIEIVSGQSFSSYLTREVFSPLAMTDTTVDATRIAPHDPATGYLPGPDGWIEVTPDHSRTPPASTLSTTAKDMASWMKALLSGGSLDNRKVLAPASVALLLDRQFSLHPSLPGRTLAFQQGSLFTPRELFLVSADNGFSAALVLLPRPRIGLFLAFNGQIDPWPLASRILAPFDSPNPAIQESTPADVPVAAAELAGFWRDAAVSRQTAEALQSLVRQDRIRATAEGGLSWRSTTFEDDGAPCFRQTAGATRLCLVEASDGDTFAAVGNLVLERLDWYQTWPVQLGLWIAFTTSFLAAGWPRPVRPNTHRALRPEDRYPPSWPRSMARVAAALHFLFIAALAIFLAVEIRSGARTLLYEVPPYLLVLLSLPLAAAALTIVATGGLVIVWRSGHSSAGDRLALAALILVLLAFLPFLSSWNLLGYHL